MIEPVCQGRELIEQITTARARRNSLCIWWLGQSGFLIKSRRGLLAVDLSPSEHLTQKYEGSSRPHVRMTRAPIRGEDLASLNLLLASHKHSDHLDPGTLPGILKSSPGLT